MKRFYLNEFNETELNNIKHSLPNWLSLHIDYDNEISIMIEGFGKNNKTPLCNPVCRYCYTVQIPQSEKEKLINYTKDLLPHDILNNPNLKNDVLEGKKYSKKFGLPLRVCTSGKGLSKDAARFLVKNVDILEITLNSPFARTRSVMMGTSEEQSEKEIDIINNLRHCNKVYLSNIISAHNYSETKDILDFGKDYTKNILIPIAVTKWSREKHLTKEERRKIIKLSQEYKNAVLSGTFFSQLTEFLPLFLKEVDLNIKLKRKNLLISSPSFGFVIKEIAKHLNQEYLEIKSSMGGNITSAGLLLGQDIIKSVKKKDLSNIHKIIVPYISLNEGRFIDGISLKYLSELFNKEFVRGPKNYNELPRFLAGTEKLDWNRESK